MLIPAAILLLLGLPAGSAGAGDRPGLEEWPDGPIRYIMRPKERKAFRALDNESERALFIERFWLRRDPTPDTLVNEYRQLFWQRVQETNGMFHDSPKPGWMTDRGKIYILYGAPTEVKDYFDLAPQSSSTSARGVIRWIYEGRPEGRDEMDPITVVPFVRDYSGEYHVSYDPKLSSVFFDELAIKEGRTQRWDRYFQRIGGISGDSRLSVMLDLGKMQEVPPQESVLIARVEDSESFDTYPLKVQIDRIHHPDRNGDSTSISLDLPGETMDSPPALMARLTPRNDPSGTLVLGEDSFRIQPLASGGLIAQSRVVLSPGTWDLILIAADAGTLQTGIHEESITVPERSGRFSLSDIILASRLEPVEVPALASYDEPFLVGSFRIVPAVGRPYHPGGNLALLYEIYEGARPYQVTYRLQGREDDGRWVALGRPSVIQNAQAVQGWDLPLGKRWPLGDYRILLEVKDAEGQTLEREIPFSLEAPPAESNAPGTEPPEENPAPPSPSHRR